MLNMETNTQLEYFTLLLKGTDLLGILDENLPTPNKIQLLSGAVAKFAIMYHIAGYTGTKKSREYFNDIVARFFLTLPIQERLPYELDTAYEHERVYKLKEFGNLKSLKARYGKINYNPSNNDLIFWSLKVYVEQSIIDFGGFVPYQHVQIWAFNMFEHKAKDRSTLKAKCRSVWSWYEQRDWKLSLLSATKRELKSKEDIMATRLEHIKKVNVNRKNKVKVAIRTVLEDMFMQEQIRYKNGNYKITEIAELTNISTKTVAKYLKEMGIK